MSWLVLTCLIMIRFNSTDMSRHVLNYYMTKYSKLVSFHVGNDAIWYHYTNMSWLVLTCLTLLFFSNTNWCNSSNMSKHVSLIQIDTILQTCWDLSWICKTSDTNWCDSCLNMFRLVLNPLKYFDTIWYDFTIMQRLVRSMVKCIRKYYFYKHV